MNTFSRVVKRKGTGITQNTREAVIHYSLQDRGQNLLDKHSKRIDYHTIGPHIVLAGDMLIR